MNGVYIGTKRFNAGEITFYDDMSKTAYVADNKEIEQMLEIAYIDTSITLS